MSMLIVDLQGYITHTCSYKVAVQFKTCQKRMNFWPFWIQKGSLWSNPILTDWGNGQKQNKCCI